MTSADDHYQARYFPSRPGVGPTQPQRPLPDHESMLSPLLDTASRLLQGLRILETYVDHRHAELRGFRKAQDDRHWDIPGGEPPRVDRTSSIHQPVPLSFDILVPHLPRHTLENLKKIVQVQLESASVARDPERREEGIWLFLLAGLVSTTTPEVLELKDEILARLESRLPTDPLPQKRGRVRRVEAYPEVPCVYIDGVEQSTKLTKAHALFIEHLFSAGMGNTISYKKIRAKHPDGIFPGRSNRFHASLKLALSRIEEFVYSDKSGFGLKDIAWDEPVP